MPPITCSMTMGKAQEEGVDKGEGSSSPKAEGNLVSMMSKMMTQIGTLTARMKESEARAIATQNTLFEKLNTLKEKRRMRPPTPMSNVVPNEVPEDVVEKGVYEGWQGGNDRDRVNHLENEWFEGENGANRRFGGGNGGYGRFGVGNKLGGMDPYVDRFRRDRYYEEEHPRRSYGEYMGNEYGIRMVKVDIGTIGAMKRIGEEDMKEVMSQGTMVMGLIGEV